MVNDFLMSDHVKSGHKTFQSIATLQPHNYSYNIDKYVKKYKSKKERQQVSLSKKVN